MLKYPKELIADRTLYGWEVVRAYHTVWLQQLEYNRAGWTEGETKLGFKRALVRHSTHRGSKAETELMRENFKKT